MWDKAFFQAFCRLYTHVRGSHFSVDDTNSRSEYTTRSSVSVVHRTKMISKYFCTATLPAVVCVSHTTFGSFVTQYYSVIAETPSGYSNDSNRVLLVSFLPFSPFVLTFRPSPAALTEKSTGAAKRTNNDDLVVVKKFAWSS